MAELLKDLLAGCARGDPEAVTILIERFAPAAQDLANLLLKDQHLAEDAVQAAFITALARLDQLRQSEAFAAWLRQIVRTQCSRILRRRHEQPGSVIEDVAGTGGSPEQVLEREELCQVVRQALAQISPLGRQTAEMFYFEEYSVADIAQALRVPKGTVKRRLHDVRAQLRNILL